jgi:curved DNA-binding protein CbpA
MQPNYYLCLGLAKTAGPDDIKKSYRELALRLHPDKNKEAGAHERFVEINQAYFILSDAQRRAVYDQHLQVLAEGRGPSVPADDLVQWAGQGSQQAQHYSRYTFAEFSGDVLSNLLAEGFFGVVWDGVEVVVKGTGEVLGEILSNIDL